MPLVSMKRTKSMTSEDSPILSGGSVEEDEFPWGLQITLEDEELEKLKTQFKIGESVELKAVAKVTGMREEADGEPKRSVTLQITSLGFGEDVANADDAAKKIYPNLGGE